MLALKKHGFPFIYTLFSCSIATHSFAEATGDNALQSVDYRMEEVHVWGRSQDISSASYVSPTSLLTREDIKAINAATTEDLVKYEPSLVIRRRFIGDANGTLGIRGSNMFQTSRSMVFADGVPLHYLLQSRWNGAPRWTMVSASEIAQVEVIYGPFSAEYSGNAMGGVVLIETAIPQQRELHADVAYFNQTFDEYGFDGNVDGFKAFASYGDKLGNASLYFSYNHLDNAAQPQTFRDVGFSAAENGENGRTVNGGIIDNDARGNPRLWHGDTGIVNTTTDNLKFKFGYDHGAWQSLLNIAFEDRQSDNVGNTYIRDLAGNALWAGQNVQQNGNQFSFGSARINQTLAERQSLSLGYRLKGELSDTLNLEANINQFNILEDQRRSSALHPQDPGFTPAGQIQDYNNSGWQTAEVKLRAQELWLPGLEVISGARYEHYELNLDVFNSSNYAAGTKEAFSSRFGGETAIAALYSQANWDINTHWDLSLGLRYERFESRNGYYDADKPDTPQLDLSFIPSESKTAFSPKFSVGYTPQDTWLVRYSLARAWRFPIVEELFSQYRAYNTVALSNPELEPERGLHHNLMVNKALADGYVRVNLFYEQVNNAIESQIDTSSDVRSFVPIDEVEVQGAEFIVNREQFIWDKFALRFNLTWLDASVVDNSSAESGANFNPENSIAGKVYPRMPKWRSHLLATYAVNSAWDISANLQYASDSYGRIDNTDRENNVYGAQDAFTRLGVKTTYQVNPQWKVGLGIDNLTNEIAYVAHPWPGRTAYFTLEFDM